MIIALSRCLIKPLVFGARLPRKMGFENDTQAYRDLLSSHHMPVSYRRQPKPLVSANMHEYLPMLCFRITSLSCSFHIIRWDVYLSSTCSIKEQYRIHAFWRIIQVSFK
jgi:hypothetical protein